MERQNREVSEWGRIPPSRQGYRRVDIPFELVGEVAGSGAVAEARHVQGGSTARHDGDAAVVVDGGGEKRENGESGISPCQPGGYPLL